MTLDPLDNTLALELTVLFGTYDGQAFILFTRKAKDAEDAILHFYDPKLHLDQLWISPTPKALPAPESPNSLGDGTSMKSCGETVSQWIQFCSRYHSTCNKFRQPDWYPSRLLDLAQNSGEDTERSISLIENQDAPLTGPYVTLSHCWGGATICKLEKDTLVQLKRGMNLEQLPKTFVDAIAVATYLRIRYIWIDSLTIVQDDEEDWTRESSAMEQVYQNSFCNIGATGSNNSHGGLFFER